MARRFSSRGISKDRVYTVKLAARIIGVSEATFRKWAKDGLRLVADKKPYLIRGADLIDFLRRREASNKVMMGKGQFFCMACKAPHDPRAGSVTFHPATESTGRLSALCGGCGGKVGQFCKADRAVDFGALSNSAPSAESQAYFDPAPPVRNNVSGAPVESGELQRVIAPNQTKSKRNTT